jgi:hypothetical protein
VKKVGNSSSIADLFCLSRNRKEARGLNYLKYNYLFLVFSFLYQKSGITLYVIFRSIYLIITIYSQNLLIRNLKIILSNLLHFTTTLVEIRSTKVEEIEKFEISLNFHYPFTSVYQTTK